MFFATILPAVSAIMVPLAHFADAGVTVMPCEATASNPTFIVTDFTGGISRYTGGESFTFYLSTNFNDYSSGCSGSIIKGAIDNGLEWCSTRVPGWNVSFVMTSDHIVNLGNNFLCNQADGTVIAAHAEGSANLGVNTSINGKLSISPPSTAFPALVKLP
ncbi:hypothetical protein GGS21DRAFT_532339 [Xylaria nigripes]|nr:hypothetical protein GGS21DRAFT_532339 [Xylaria nigripes]